MDGTGAVLVLFSSRGILQTLKTINGVVFYRLHQVIIKKIAEERRRRARDVRCSWSERPINSSSVSGGKSPLLYGLSNSRWDSDGVKILREQLSPSLPPPPPPPGVPGVVHLGPEQYSFDDRAKSCGRACEQGGNCTCNGTGDGFSFFARDWDVNHEGTSASNDSLGSRRIDIHQTSGVMRPIPLTIGNKDDSLGILSQGTSDDEHGDTVSIQRNPREKTYLWSTEERTLDNRRRFNDDRQVRAGYCQHRLENESINGSHFLLQARDAPAPRRHPTGGEHLRSYPAVTENGTCSDPTLHHWEPKQKGQQHRPDWPDDVDRENTDELHETQGQQCMPWSVDGEARLARRAAVNQDVYRFRSFSEQVNFYTSSARDSAKFLRALATAGEYHLTCRQVQKLSLDRDHMLENIPQITYAGITSCRANMTCSAAENLLLYDLSKRRHV